MASLNTCTIVGNLGADPKLTTSSGGMALCRFSVGVNERGRDGNDRTTWFSVTCFEKAAESAAKHLRKGSQVLCTGRVTARVYDVRGQAAASLDLAADRVVFLGARPKADEAGGDATQDDGGSPVDQARDESIPF